MNLLELKYFQTVAKLEHMTKAAKLLNISQPSLSQYITRLEQRLGTPLFDRVGRNIRLNKYGTCLLKHVNTIFTELVDIEREIGLLKDAENKQVIVATTNSIFSYRCVAKFIKLHRAITVRQHVLNKDDIFEGLKSGTINYSIMPEAEHDTQIESQFLFPTKYVLLVSTENPLAKRKSVDLRDIQHEPIICLSTIPGNLRIADILFTKVGCSPNIAFEGPSEMLMDMLRLNKGILFSINDHRDFNLNLNGIQVLDIKNTDCNINIYLYWKRGKERTHAEKIFYDFVLDYSQLYKSEPAASPL